LDPRDFRKSIALASYDTGMDQATTAAPLGSTSGTISPSSRSAALAGSRLACCSVAGDWQQLDFVGVLATLQSWLGQVVRVSVETGHPDRPLGLAHVTGVLRASGSMFDPRGWDEDEYPFELHPVADHVSGFSLDSEWFHGASLGRDGRLLVVNIGAPKDDPAQAPELYITLQSDVSVDLDDGAS
jgi:hypothetical protein